jgi:predicted  nucleic acid-binding Zn-ribbon protein
MPKFKERVSIHVGDLRTLCRQCRNDYLVAGYITLKTNNEMLGSCDKCGRPGFDYIIIKKEGEKKNVRTENTGRGQADY